MFSESAEYYDLLYRWKDYRAEADALRQLFAKFAPQGRSILDVGCGTGEHLRFLPEFAVEGIDVDPVFVRIASQKRPDGRFQVGDMARFRLEGRFDIVLCLFSSIGYLLDDEAIHSALCCLRNHLAPDGTIFIEPWFEPEIWISGSSKMLTAEDGERKVCRVMTSDREGENSILMAHYLFVEGIRVRHAVERHELRLLTRQQWIDFFQGAGLRVEYLQDGLASRGLYVATAIA